jgi:hypothetical protein
VFKLLNQLFFYSSSNVFRILSEKLVALYRHDRFERTTETVLFIFLPEKEPRRLKVADAPRTNNDLGLIHLVPIMVADPFALRWQNHGGPERTQDE